MHAVSPTWSDHSTSSADVWTPPETADMAALAGSWPFAGFVRSWVLQLGLRADAKVSDATRAQLRLTSHVLSVFVAVMVLLAAIDGSAVGWRLLVIAICYLPHVLVRSGRVGAGLAAVWVCVDVSLVVSAFMPGGHQDWLLLLLLPATAFPLLTLRRTRSWVLASLANLVMLFTLLHDSAASTVEIDASTRLAAIITIYAILALTRMERDNVVLSASHMARDLRQSDEARRALEADGKAKMTFLATMSHELRTPLHATIGMSELLCESLAHDEQRDMAESVRSSSTALLGIINDVLDFTRIDAGGLTLTPAPTMLDEALEQTAMALHASAKPGVELCVDLHVPLGFSVSIDAVRLRQVLTNLTGNALKFTTQGHVIVRASLAKDDSRPRWGLLTPPMTPSLGGGGSERQLQVDAGPACQPGDEVTVLLSVEDTGCGIRPEEQGGIFDAFTQVQASTTREHDGTGLGLAISKQIVEQMGGTLALSSEEGRGSVFFARLPVTVTSALPTTPPAPVRVLLVLPRSQPMLCATLKRLLRSLNCRVAAAHDVLRLSRSIDAVFATPDVELPSPEGGADAVPVIRLVPPAGVRALPPGTPRVMLPARRAAVLRVLREHVAQPERLASCPVPVELPPLVAKRGSGPGLVDLGSVRLLVAEDNAVSRKVIRAMLERLGCDFTVVNDGEQAVNAFDAAGDGAFTAVLMDCHMPVMDGYEATRRIRALEAERRWRRTRIVALTADAFDTARIAALKSGMDDMVTKPITKGALAKLVSARPLSASGVSASGVSVSGGASGVSASVSGASVSGAEVEAKSPT